MIIDNVGFDVAAMAELSEKEFIELHLPNDAIAPRMDEKSRREWLKKAYAAINPQSKEDKKGPAKKG